MLCKSFPRFILRPLQILVAVLLSFGAYYLYLQSFGNFHAVVDGEIYRAAQPTAAELDDYTARYGIRSVINLRGENTGNPWYDAEVAESKHLGLTHYDFRMKSSRELTEEQAKALIAMMRNAPKPVLIHCMHGSDRSGLAAALYVAAIEKGTEQEASSQLSLRYGHVPFSFSGGHAMTVSFEHLKPMLGFTPEH